MLVTPSLAQAAATKSIITSKVSMASAAHTRAALLMVALSVLGLATGGHAQLQNGFYKGKCGANDVEAIVQSVVKARFTREAAIVAHLLRLQFHECAVNVRIYIYMEKKLNKLPKILVGP